MSRSRRTPEAGVLAYFRQAPLGEAQMVLGLVRDLMRERAPAPKRKPKAKVPGEPGETSSQ